MVKRWATTTKKTRIITIKVSIQLKNLNGILFSASINQLNDMDETHEYG